MRAPAPSRQTGLLIITVAFLIAPGMDVFAKLLTQTVSPGQTVLGRFLIQTTLLLPLLALFSQWSRPRLGHWVAGVFLAAALLCFNAALQVMPIANAIAIFFVEPLILTVLSALILKEQIGWRRILAVLVGLIGAMIVIRPNFAAYGPTALLPLGTALGFAGYVLINRVMTVGGNLLALQFWTGVGSSVVIGAACLWGHGADVTVLVLDWPTVREAWLFLGMGAMAVLTHQMLVLALSMLPASVLAPMQYLEIVSATLFGWWIFGDFPDLLTWVGTAIIIGAGVYVFHRERKVKGEP
ncbi:MAG: DMT family transporter [Pseudomonadota bacterium]